MFEKFFKKNQSRETIDVEQVFDAVVESEMKETEEAEAVETFVETTEEVNEVEAQEPEVLWRISLELQMLTL